MKERPSETPRIIRNVADQRRSLDRVTYLSARSIALIALRSNANPQWLARPG